MSIEPKVGRDYSQQMRAEQMSVPVTTLDDLPLTESYIIVKAITVHVEGDERSRTNPGHGYPAHEDRTVQIVEVFKDDQAFKHELAYLLHKSDALIPPFRGFKITPYVARTIVEISAAVHTSSNF